MQSANPVPRNITNYVNRQINSVGLNVDFHKIPPQIFLNLIPALLRNLMQITHSVKLDDQLVPLDQLPKALSEKLNIHPQDKKSWAKVAQIVLGLIQAFKSGSVKLDQFISLAQLKNMLENQKTMADLTTISKRIESSKMPPEQAIESILKPSNIGANPLAVAPNTYPAYKPGKQEKIRSSSPALTQEENIKIDAARLILALKEKGIKSFAALDKTITYKGFKELHFLGGTQNA